jgi:hypothetical protein
VIAQYNSNMRIKMDKYFTITEWTSRQHIFKCPANADIGFILPAQNERKISFYKDIDNILTKGNKIRYIAVDIVSHKISVECDKKLQSIQISVMPRIGRIYSKEG